MPRSLFPILAWSISCMCAAAIAATAAPQHAPAAAAPSSTGVAAGHAASNSTTSTEAVVRKAITTIAPDAKVDSVVPSPIPGVMAVETSHDLVYVTADGKYLLTGSMIEVATRRDVTEIARAAARRGLIKALTPSQMIVFAPPHPKYTVTVFTDVDCGFCRRLHSQIADYNKAGIAVDYLFFPRTGIGGESYDKAVSVWCSANRQQALTDAKRGMPVKKLNCTNPVTMDYNLGLRFGVDGTPAIYASDGTQLGGYLTPAQMKTKLDRLAPSRS